VLPRRWVVSAPSAGWAVTGRLNRDYERQAKTGETMVQLAMFRSCSHAWPSSNRFFNTL